MVNGQGMDVQRVAQIDGQRLDSIPGQLLGQEPLQIPRHLQLSETSLDGYLPAARRTKEQLVATVGDDLAHPIRHLRFIKNPPQEGMGVKQRPHRSKDSKTSSGSGASKSSLSTACPTALPGRRRFGRSSTETSRATGFPALAMMTSSP